MRLPPCDLALGAPLSPAATYLLLSTWTEERKLRLVAVLCTLQRSLTRLGLDRAAILINMNLLLFAW